MNYSLYANILQIKNYIPIEKNECKNLIKLIQLPSLTNIHLLFSIFCEYKIYKILFIYFKKDEINPKNQSYCY